MENESVLPIPLALCMWKSGRENTQTIVHSLDGWLDLSIEGVVVVV